ncbi:LysM peptidoglycan-binding domain-containing protein [Arthrobacter sp. zg-Y877]|uniref:LysM peptidoglycan-binding domain-containing protein n=1 Tax=Arthrobacter sp. zg-Y877 TaxID=3049074 RepID=UPI0025A39DE4|nr:LysM peptidoglycan-binding domain-containing protein [Arthrobacter sp. zg-Y877]MDM7989823.1 LysM peptidoglycan-binding domain-containing protein [Arthrobacter sp. zg-Y877]
MTVSVPRPGLAADALTAAAVAGLGLLLLWCGSRMLPAAAAGSAAFAPDPLSPEPLSFATLTQIAGFCAAAAGVLLTLWWVAGSIFALAGCLLHRSGFRTAARRTLSLAPGPLRRLAAAALGLSLAAGGALGTAPMSAASTPVAAAAAAARTTLQTAHPTAADAPGAGTAAATSATSATSGQQDADGAGTPETADAGEAVSPLWRPAPPQPAAGNLLTGSPRQDEREVVVAAGDTLWSLAAAQLGPYATDAETAALWPRWYELNRDVIGPDPGLIHPGQVLAMPPR